jgi:hypothetical protein
MNNTRNAKYPANIGFYRIKKRERERGKKRKLMSKTSADGVKR